MMGGDDFQAFVAMMKGGGGGKGYGKADGGGGKGYGGQDAAWNPWGGKGCAKGGGGGKWGVMPPMNQKPMWTFVPGTYYEEPGGTCGIEGLKDAITRATEPYLPTETKWTHEDMVNKICLSIFKSASKWQLDDLRHKENGSAIQAQALLEEFTEKIMGGLSAACHDKPWFLEIYLSEGIALAAISTFKGGPLFKRTVAPIIVTHIDEAVFRYREAERHTQVMWDAIASVGIKADYQKKGNKHLTTSFESAHIAAKYGTSPATSPALGMLQDFLTAWIRDFCNRGWDVLNSGIASPTQDQQIGVVTTLFQYLCDPDHSCLPHDLLKQLDAPPPGQWDFVGQTVIQMFAEHQ